MARARRNSQEHEIAQHSAWLNAVEGFFAKLTARRLICAHFCLSKFPMCFPEIAAATRRAIKPLIYLHRPCWRHLSQAQTGEFRGRDRLRSKSARSASMPAIPSRSTRAMHSTASASFLGAMLSIAASSLDGSRWAVTHSSFGTPAMPNEVGLAQPAQTTPPTRAPSPPPPAIGSVAGRSGSANLSGTSPRRATIRVQGDRQRGELAASKVLHYRLLVR